MLHWWSRTFVIIKVIHGKCILHSYMMSVGWLNSFPFFFFEIIICLHHFLLSFLPSRPSSLYLLAFLKLMSSSYLVKHIFWRYYQEFYQNENICCQFLIQFQKIHKWVLYLIICPLPLSLLIPSVFPPFLLKSIISYLITAMYIKMCIQIHPPECI